MESVKAKQYQQLVKEREPKSKTALMCLRAFIIGGLICCLGQLIRDMGEAYLGLDKELSSAFCCICLVGLAAFLTGLGVYDKLGKFAGAGSVVPITGFANSMVAPAMEFKSEGMVLGLGAKMFSVAGPVLAYGVISSIITGLLSLLFQ